jgi:hypothetical protein
MSIYELGNYEKCIHRVNLTIWQYLIDIAVPPKVTTTSMKVEATEGSEAVMSCVATGLPPPKYEFYKVMQHFCLDRIIVFILSLTISLI